MGKGIFLECNNCGGKIEIGEGGKKLPHEGSGSFLAIVEKDRIYTCGCCLARARTKTVVFNPIRKIFELIFEFLPPS